VGAGWRRSSDRLTVTIVPVERRPIPPTTPYEYGVFCQAAVLWWMDGWRATRRSTFRAACSGGP
jgi:hypothetical protein